MLGTAQIVVFRPGALGDTMLATEALLGLRAAFPGSEIDLVAHGEAARLLCQCGVVDRATSFDATEVTGLFLAEPVVPERWRGARLVVLWMAGSERLATAFAEVGATDVVSAPGQPARGATHVGDYLTQTLRGMGVKAALEPALLAWPCPGGGGGARDAVVIHPGSGAGRKNWAPGHYARLIETLQERGPPPIVCAGPADDGVVRDLYAILGAKALRLVRPVGIDSLADLLVRASAYVGNDSGVSHLAALLGTPTVAIFGATNPDQWAPRGRFTTTVGTEGQWPPFDEVRSELERILIQQRTPAAWASGPGS